MNQNNQQIQANYYVPTIIEKSGGVERAYDIYSRLLKDRIVFLGSEVNDAVANAIIAQFLFLEYEDETKDVHFWINSPGGVVTAGLAIYDVMRFIKPAVNTYCVGQAASMGAFLLCGGEKGKRYSLPSSRIMIHQPSGGAGGQATDIVIQADEIIRLKKYLTTEMANNCGQDYQVMYDSMERDNFLSASEAIEMGLVDEIISTVKK